MRKLRPVGLRLEQQATLLLAVPAEDLDAIVKTSVDHTWGAP
jgi:hypothetical protein